MTTVSVIIPCHNHADYLPDAIRSALQQQGPPAQIIVVDDGSSDDTRSVATSFEPAIRYVFQENRGLPAARNTGLAQATGEAVVFLDADDLLEPGYITAMTGVLERDPGAAAVYCGFRMVDPANRPLPQTGLRPLPASALYAALLDGNFIVPPCMMIRRDALGERPFDEQLTACEDWDVWLRLAHVTRVASLDAVLVRYRIRPGSMSGDATRMLANRLAVLEKHVGAPDDPASARPTARAHRDTALEYVQAGRMDEAATCLHTAVLLDPLVLDELETFYELALWNQPKGLRGDFATAPDPAAVEPQLFALLDRLLAGPSLPDGTRALRPRTYALAYRALGLISYGRRDLAAARRYFGRSLAAAPGQFADPAVVRVVARSLLPATLLPKAKERD